MRVFERLLVALSGAEEPATFPACVFDGHLVAMPALARLYALMLSARRPHPLTFFRRWTGQICQAVRIESVRIFRWSLRGGLFYCGGPDTIVRRVALVIINAMNAVLWRWALPYVCQKSGEVIHPSFADRDPPSAVIFPCRRVLIQTALLHRTPRLVFWCAPPSGVAVRDRRAAVFTPLDSETPARLCSRWWSDNDFFLAAAVASCDPISGAFRSWVAMRKTDHRQTTKAITGSVSWRNPVRHGCIVSANATIGVRSPA